MPWCINESLKIAFGAMYMCIYVHTLNVQLKCFVLFMHTLQLLVNLKTIMTQML